MRKSASEPRPLDFMQWAERDNEVPLTASLTVSRTVRPHPMTPLKGLSRFRIRNNISGGEKKAPHSTPYIAAVSSFPRCMFCF